MHAAIYQRSAKPNRRQTRTSFLAFVCLLATVVLQTFASAADTVPSVSQYLAIPRVGVGGIAVFSVSANGTAPLNYQWYFNGTTIAGTAAPDLVLKNLQAAQAGSYFVVITNAFGAATSTVAVLTVDASPVAPPNLFVTNLFDAGPGSLRQAIIDANASPGPDMIGFLTLGTIGLASPLPEIAEDLIVVGPGTNLLAVSGSNAFQILTIRSGTSNTISGLKISDGSANASPGAGLANNGTTILMDCQLVGHHAGTGGAVANSGILSIIHSTLSGNYAQGSNGPGGGAILNNGALTVFESTLNSNGAMDTDSGGGGGILNFGTLSIVGSTIKNNYAYGKSGLPYGQVGGGAKTAFGGGIFVKSGDVAISNSTFSGNAVTGGSGPAALNFGQTGGSGAEGAGGGISVENGSVAVINSTFVGNIAQGGSPGCGYSACGSAGTGSGGASFVAGGSVALTNVTLAGNQASGGYHSAGAVFVSRGSVALVNASVVLNKVLTNDTGGFSCGGIYNDFVGSVSLLNCLICSNYSRSEPDLQGQFSSQGFNLIGEPNGASGLSPNDLITNYPGIGLLQANGGPTFTHDLLPDSPAIDAGRAFGAPSFDQRGVPRPYGAAVDIGAVEYYVPPNSDPRIAYLSASQTVFTGTTLALKVLAASAVPLNYQWFFDGHAAAGATNSVLTITNVQPDNQGGYWVQVSNIFGAVTSAVVSVTVLLAPPSIVQSPESQAVLINNSLVLTVNATGWPPLNYQWQINGIDLPSATFASLSLSNMQFSQAGFYSVRVINSFGAITSSVANVSVLSSQPPQFEWVRSPGPTNYPYVPSLAVDDQGRYYLAADFRGDANFGITNLSGSQGFLFAKFNATGTAQWVRQAGANPLKVTLDRQGNSYLTGEYYGGAFGVLTNAGGENGSDVFVAKYDGSGTLLWARGMGGPNSDDAGSVAIDQEGNCYATGRFDRSARFGTTNLTSAGADFFLAKYNAAGDLQWVRQGNGSSRGLGVAVDADGNVFAAGYFYSTITFGTNTFAPAGPYSFSDAFIVKYNSAGVVQWAQRAGGAASDYGVDMASDVHGNCYVVGYFGHNTGGTATFGDTTIVSIGQSDLFLAKYSNAGTLQWVRTGGGIGSDVALNLAVDKGENCFINGFINYAGASSVSNQLATFGSNVIAASTFIAKYDSFGSVQWVKPFIDGFAAGALAVDSLGNCYLASPDTPIAMLPSNAFPKINSLSASRAVTAETNVTLTAEVSAAQPIFYQWQKNGTNIPGANDASLVIRNIQAAGAGVFDIVVTNAYGAITSSPITLTVRFLLSTQTNGSGHINVSPDEPSYSFGEVVALTATPARWRVFNGWSDGNTNNPRLVVINSNLSYTAIFTPVAPLETLTYGPVSREAPVGMPAIFVNGQFITNTASTNLRTARISIQTTFAHGNIFYTLNGSPPSRASRPYIDFFTLRGSSMVRAIAYNSDFSQSWEADPVQVTIIPAFLVSVAGGGGGTVALSSANSPYLSNTLLSVTAQPATGWTFLQWLGDVDGTNSVATMLISRDKCVEAVFGTRVCVAASSNGVVEIGPSAEIYPYGTPCTFIGEPLAGNYFEIWTNSASGTDNPLRFVVTNANPVISALFAPLSGGDYSLIVTPLGFGQVFANPKGNRFNDGQIVTLTATPDVGQEFVGWSRDASGTNTQLVITMNQTKFITASFTRRPSFVDGPCATGFDDKGFRIRVNGEMGGASGLDQSGDLVNWTHHLTVTNILGAVQFIDTAATNVPQRFYRLVSPPE